MRYKAICCVFGTELHILMVGRKSHLEMTIKSIRYIHNSSKPHFKLIYNNDFEELIKEKYVVSVLLLSGSEENG